MMDDPLPSALDNERLLPSVIDELALREPDSVWSLYPRSDSCYRLGFRHVTYREFANAINVAAWWIETNIGTSQDFETLAYFGPNDLRYPIFIIAAVKTGHKLLLTWPHNDTAAHINLFTNTHCKTLLTPIPLSPIVAAISEQYRLKTHITPKLEHLLDTPYYNFPYEKTWQTSHNEPLVVLQTSGSTDHPKPIVVPHAFATAFANISQLEAPEGYINQTQYLHGKRLFSPLPPFHAVGVYFGLVSAVFNRTVVIIPPHNATLSGQSLAIATEKANIDAALIPPSIVEDIGNSDILLNEVASNLETICYTGADLPAQIGDKVATKMRLFTIYGTTEMGHGPQIAAIDRDPRDWKYIQWNEKFFALEFKHSAADMYELCLTRSPISRPYQTAFTIFNDDTQHRTKDLFTPHPKSPGLWCYCERVDNIIVFLNGENFSPTGIEGKISAHADVRSTLMIGSMRYQAALLLEMASIRFLTPTGRAHVIERLWPTIEEINFSCPSYARITKSHILITQPPKPMSRTPKGTVVRRKTIELYAGEIEKLYSDASYQLITATKEDLTKHSILQNPIALEALVKQCAETVLGFELSDSSHDFFAFGMHSTQAMQMLRTLRTVCDIDLSTVYTNPTIHSLVDKMLNIGDSSEGSDFDKINKILEEGLSKIGALSRGQVPTFRGERRDKREVVILIGSTGTIGPYLLRQLLLNSRVLHIYCINRNPEAANLTKSFASDRDLGNVPDPKRVTFVTADLSRNYMFGLDNTPVIEKIVAEVTLIIHNAWHVDFNLGLGSFIDQLNGVLHLAEFSAKAKLRPCIAFVSSISSVQNYSGAVVPEVIIKDPKVSGPTGYGQSKWIAERFLDHAANILGIEVRILRLGQVAGPIYSKGIWNQREWLPSLVLSARLLGMVPSSFPALMRDLPQCGEVDWVPVDVLAEVIISVVLVMRSAENCLPISQVYHFANPQVIQWASLADDILTWSPAGAAAFGEHKMTLVRYATWLNALRKCISDAAIDNESFNAVVEANPAIKLLSFYDSLAEGAKSIPRLSTNYTQKFSAKLRKMPPIAPWMMRKWLYS